MSGRDPVLALLEAAPLASERLRKWVLDRVEKAKREPAEWVDHAAVVAELERRRGGK